MQVAAISWKCILLFVNFFEHLNVYFPVFEWSLKRLNSSTRRSWRFTRRWRTSWLIVMHINEFHRILFQVERPQLVRWKYLILERMTILYTFGNSSEILTSKQPTSFFLQSKWTRFLLAIVSVYGISSSFFHFINTETSFRLANTWLYVYVSINYRCDHPISLASDTKYGKRTL